MFKQIIRWLLTFSFAVGGTTIFLFFNKIKEWIIVKEQIFILATVIFLVSFLIGMILSTFFANMIMNTTDQTVDNLNRRPVKEILLETLGVTVGLVIATLISLPFLLNLPFYGIIINIFLNLILGYLGYKIALIKKEEIQNLNFQTKEKKKNKSYGQPKVLDTSVIIDGRIKDILSTDFLEGKMIVPSFILDELRHIADSSDALKRNRGRRGLDILNELQKQVKVVIEIVEKDYPEIAEVDIKLLKLAQDLGASVVTNDFNLNKVAEFHGVTVLNINSLSNAVKPVVLPGEEMQITVIKDGKENSQGIGYLDDGTMIVVEGGKKYIGHTVEVLVTSVLQTAAGRMIFTKIKETEKQVKIS